MRVLPSLPDDTPHGIDTGNAYIAGSVHVDPYSLDLENQWPIGNWPTGDFFSTDPWKGARHIRWQDMGECRSRITWRELLLTFQQELNPKIYEELNAHESIEEVTEEGNSSLNLLFSLNEDNFRYGNGFQFNPVDWWQDMQRSLGCLLGVTLVVVGGCDNNRSPSDAGGEATIDAASDPLDAALDRPTYEGCVDTCPNAGDRCVGGVCTRRCTNADQCTPVSGFEVWCPEYAGEQVCLLRCESRGPRCPTGTACIFDTQGASKCIPDPF